MAAARHAGRVALLASPAHRLAALALVDLEDIDMGLLGDSFDDPRTMATLQLAAGLLGGGNFGQAASRGLTGYQNTMSAANEAAALKEERDYIKQQREAKAQSARDQQAFFDGLPGAMQQMKPSYGAGMEGPTMTPGNPNAMRDYGMSKGSPFAGRLMEEQFFPKQGDPFSLTPGGARFDGSGRVIAQLAEKQKEANPNQPFMIVDGQIVPNQAYQNYEMGKTRAGAPSVTVNSKVENKASESVAKQIGPILEQSLVSAEGAVRVLDASDRVIRAIDSGKVITGPLANARVTGLQVSQMLGISGRDNAEVLANTRQAIRGLAEMTLQGRKEMSGQGAITNSESALAEKATSGDISDLTAAEIKILANASARASRYAIQKHQSRVKSAGALPGMENITPFFDVPSMPQPALPSSTPTMRFNPQTGKLEGVR